MSQAICKQATIKALSFEVCYEPLHAVVKCCDREVKIPHIDFNNLNALSWDLLQLGLSVNDAPSVALELGLVYDNLLKEIGTTRPPEEFSTCIEFEEGQCAGEYIVANVNGVFIRKLVNNKYREQKVSELKVLSINDVEFSGLSIDLGTKFVQIATPDGQKLTGGIDELTTVVKATYGLKRENEFKFLLNQPHNKVRGYYAIGIWFDGKNLEIATESLYNPSWKKVVNYRLPSDVPKDKKVEVLRRIISTVMSYKRPDIATWVLSYGLMANFSHYFRQTYGYFPHTIVIGRRQTGKTSLLSLVQYLFWGNNPLPPIRPKTEAQLRNLLSQTTLVVPLEDWRELESESTQVEDMLSLLHASAQTFVLRHITSSNKDVNGVYLSLTSILADANYNRDIDVDTLDKVVFVTLDKDEGIDRLKAEENNALLKNELRSDISLHNTLHSIGLELLQIVADKLSTVQLARDRTSFLTSVINVGYQAWLEIFRRYNIVLTTTVNGVQEFPYPTLETGTGEAEEDLELAFITFVNEKKKACEKLYGFFPTSKSEMTYCGFFVDGNEVNMEYSFVKEFSLWLEQKGFHKRGFERLKNELGLTSTNFSVNGKTYHLFKKVVPDIS